MLSRTVSGRDKNVKNPSARSHAWEKSAPLRAAFISSEDLYSGRPRLEERQRTLYEIDDVSRMRTGDRRAR